MTSLFPFSVTNGRLYLTCGQTNERYCLSSGVEVDYDGVVHDHLVRYGFERVVFFGHRGCYFLDEDSVRTTFPRQPGERECAQPKLLRHSTGISLRKGALSTTMPGDHSWLYRDLAQINQMADLVKRLLREETPQTAIVFSDVHILSLQARNTQLNHDFEALFKVTLGQLPTTNRNVLIFNIPGAPRERLQSLGWMDLLESGCGKGLARTVWFGPPNLDEVRNWLFSQYLKKRLEVNWAEWTACVTLLTSYIKREAYSLHVLQHFVGSGSLSLQSVRSFTQGMDTSLSTRTVLDELVGMEKLKTYLERKVRSFPKDLGTDAACSQDVNRLMPRPVSPALRLVNLNLILKGNPGTGKTTVCRLLGGLYREAGVLPLGHLVKVARQDLVGEYQGQTAVKTRSAIERALDGILFVDDAYALHQGENDAFGRESIDTLVEAMTAYSGRLAVVMAGYPNDMERLMKANSGLQDRFDAVITIEDYQPAEMTLILRRFFEKHPARIPLDEGFDALLEKLCTAIYGNRTEEYANARTLEKLAREMIEKAVVGQSPTVGLQHLPEAYSRFLKKTEVTSEGIIQDLDKLVGLKRVKDEIRGLLNVIRVEQRKAKRSKGKIQVAPGHFIFAGNPGTGKTTIARLFARQLFQMGLVQSPDTHETSARNLIAGYVGQTGERTRQFLEAGLNKVIFIDEAHQWRSGEGGTDFRRDALETLVPFAENHRADCVIILAGYEDQLQKMLGGDVGLKSRFPNTLHFEDYNGAEMVEIFDLYARNDGMTWPRAVCEASLSNYLEKIRETEGDSFGNARSVRNVYAHCRHCHAQRVAALEDDNLLHCFSEEDFQFLFNTTTERHAES